MSKKIYDGLPADMRKLVDDACRETVVWGRDQADKRHANRVEILTKNKVEIIDLGPELLGKMQEKAEPVYKMVRDAVGNELVDSIVAESKKAQGK